MPMWATEFIITYYNIIFEKQYSTVIKSTGLEPESLSLSPGCHLLAV